MNVASLVRQAGWGIVLCSVLAVAAPARGQDNGQGPGGGGGGDQGPGGGLGPVAPDNNGEELGPGQGRIQRPGDQLGTDIPRSLDEWRNSMTRRYGQSYRVPRNYRDSLRGNYPGSFGRWNPNGNARRWGYFGSPFYMGPGVYDYGLPRYQYFGVPNTYRGPWY